MKSVIDIAAAEIGYAENPPGTNRTKFGKWFGLNGVAWCGIFVSWAYHHAGYPLGNIGYRKGFAGCMTAVSHFRKAGKITTDPQPGDIVFFDWTGDGTFDHTGIFVRKINDTHFETIEGNTSLTNQSNGGQVMRRERHYKNAIFVHV